MKDLEQAYRTLDLKPGATVKEVIEAREGLRALWNPDRLSDHPRLRSKAIRKTQEINEAYEMLMAHLGRTGLSKASKVSEVSAPVSTDVSPTTAVSHDSLSERPPASLFDQVFPKKGSKGGRQISVWSVVTLVMIVLLVTGYFLTSTRQGESRKSPAAESVPSALPAATQQLGAVSAQPNRKPKGMAGRGIGRAAQKLGPPPLDFVSAILDSTGSARTTPPAPSARREVKKEALPRKRRPEPKASSRPREGGQRPVLVREEISSPGESAETGTKKESLSKEEETRSEEAEKSYRSLLLNSSVARTLVEGGFETLRFVGWKVVQWKAPEVWIDLMANQSNGRAVHFIWSVNVETQTVRPLSEAARNLERGKPPTKDF